MTRQLKCHKCKNPIGKDEKAFRCSDCETYPFHEGCLNDEGCCPECAREEEGVVEGAKEQTHRGKKTNKYAIRVETIIS